MDRAPGLSVRLKLTLSYAGFLMLAGALLLAAVWVFLLRYVPDGDQTSPVRAFPFRSVLLRDFAPTAAAAVLVFLLVFGLLGGWLLAGRMLAPLTRITDATRMAATGSLSHRIRLQGRSDEFRELADAFDAMLARLEAHVAEQQRFAANASHELRTPLAITQTLLDVARNDPNRDNGELVDRLHVVNTRAIDLTEALLLLSRADQRSFIPRTRRPVPHRRRSHRNAPPPRREARPHHRDLRRHDPHHRLTRPPAADGDEPRAQRDRPQPARPGHRVGHDQRSPRARGAHGREHRRASSPHSWSPRSSSRFVAAPNASAPTTQASASAWRSSRASPRHTTEPSPSPPAPLAGSASRCSSPPRHRTLADRSPEQETRPTGVTSGAAQAFPSQCLGSPASC